jgi:hypothetical protein
MGESRGVSGTSPVHDHHISVKDTGPRHGVPGDPHKKGQRFITEQLFDIQKIKFVVLIYLVNLC